MHTSATVNQTPDTFRLIDAAGLPIFRRDSAEYATFYTPGCVCVVTLADAGWFESTLSGSADQDNRWSAVLQQLAKLAQERMVCWQTASFEPECLTLYLHNDCNLQCVYCYADPAGRIGPRLDPEAVVAAAHVVAAHCHRQGRLFYVVFHGGGEPTLYGNQVRDTLKQIENVALHHHVDPYYYIATNGVMSEKKARWLARHFHLIGLSCDGPPEIQERQRPCQTGYSSAKVLERTAHILHQENSVFHVRATITPQTAHRQAEIADYICHQLSPQEIHFEPVYAGGRSRVQERFERHQAGAFVSHFLEAQQVASRYGIPLTTSGSRPDAIHGPYCNLFRSVLNLVPGNVATACFKMTDAAQCAQQGLVIGALNTQTGCFEIDQAQIHTLCSRLAFCPPECTTCFNRYHCVQECPDLCWLDVNHPPQDQMCEPGFRCRVQKALSETWLGNLAEHIWETNSAHDLETWRSGDHTRRLIYGTTEYSR